MEKKSYKLKMKNIKFLLLSLFIFSCSKNEESAIQNENKISKKIIVDSQKIAKKDKSDFIYSKKHKPNFLFSDFDGDGEKDSAIIVKNLKNGKFGLKFHFANGKKEILGAGKNVLKQGFDDFNWIGVFEIAPNSGYKENFNEKYLVNTFEYKYSKYEQDKDEKGTIISSIVCGNQFSNVCAGTKRDRTYV